MTRERIEDIREIVLPFVRNVLLKTNYERLGKSDAEEFTRDFNEILDLAIKALDQEPMVEIDLYSVIKQKYIEREVLDKIRAEIQNGIHHFLDGEPIIEIKEVLQILDKNKAETEET